jgi:hypothetical protein
MTPCGVVSGFDTLKMEGICPAETLVPPYKLHGGNMIRFFLMAVTMKSTVFWSVTPCNLVEDRRRFALLESCFVMVSCLTLSSTVKMSAVRSSEISVNFYLTVRRHISALSLVFRLSRFNVWLRRSGIHRIHFPAFRRALRLTSSGMLFLGEGSELSLGCVVEVETAIGRTIYTNARIFWVKQNSEHLWFSCYVHINTKSSPSGEILYPFLWVDTKFFVSISPLPLANNSIR